MRYEYAGFLDTLLEAPDAARRDALAHIEFTADDLKDWSLADDMANPEWKNVPVFREKSGEAVLLEGRFEGVRRIDMIGGDTPCYWVALSSRHWEDPRFPVDIRRYPMVEITYRCSSPDARPMCLWEYKGGAHLVELDHSDTWRCVARRIPHQGFPEQVDRLTFRLYSMGRSTVSMEIQSVRFREMSEVEKAICEKAERDLLAYPGPKSPPLLDEFMPLGVFMNVGSCKRLASQIDVSLEDYFRLATEDIARHHHNCIVLEETEDLSPAEWNMLLPLCEDHRLRLFVLREWPLELEPAELGKFVEKVAGPFAGSDALLGWGFNSAPSGKNLKEILVLRDQLERVDPNHPLAVLMQDPNAYAFFAPHLAASGVSHFKSHTPWDIGKITNTHCALSRGHRFWVTAPAFTHASGFPGWNTCPEMRLMINQSIANGARGWFAYAYHNDPVWVHGNCQRSLTGPFLTFSDLWAELGHRMERFTAMAPLFLNSVPGNPPDVDIEIAWEVHPRSRRPDGVAPLEWIWSEGPDFWLLYIVSNDTGEMTPVNLRVPDSLPRGLEVHDITDFVRSRNWAPMSRKRHLEMYPGQGQVILIGEAKACAYWRDVMISRIKRDDQRQVGFDLALAQRYDLDISDVQRLVQQVGRGSSLDDLMRMQEARDELINIFYRAKGVAETRSELIKISAALCGCDGTLCRLMKMDKVDLARSLGEQVLPLTQEMTKLRLELRLGHAPEIQEQCVELSEKTLALLGRIRARV